MVLDSSESGCPLQVMVKLLYQPNGLLLTSYPLPARFSPSALSILMAGSREARLVERWAYGYTITRFAFTQPRTSSIEPAAFSAILSGASSSCFSTVQNATSPSSREPFLIGPSSGSGCFTHFSRASNSQFSWLNRNRPLG